MQQTSTMLSISRAAAAWILSFAGFAEVQAAGGTGAACAATPEAAAIAFVQSSLQSPLDGIPWLTPVSLASFRARLAQMLDDRYAPASAELRRRLNIEHLASVAAAQMSDAEFVGAYFVAGSARAAPVTQVGAVAAERRKVRYLGETVTVRYRISVQGHESAQERTYYPAEDNGCWRIDVPSEARARLDQLASFLKESRVDPQLPAGKAARLALRVAPAAGSAFPASTRFSTSSNMGSPVWVSDAALITEKELDGVSAYWDCNLSSRGTEDAALRLHFDKASAARLEVWSATNVGSMLAIVLEGEVVTYAKVQSKLGDRLTICLTGKTLEQAQDIARRLAG